MVLLNVPLHRSPTYFYTPLTKTRLRLKSVNEHSILLGHSPGQVRLFIEKKH